MSQFTNFTFRTEDESLKAFLNEIDSNYSSQLTKDATFYRAANLRFWVRDRAGFKVVDGTIEQDAENHDHFILSIIHNPNFKSLNIAI